LLPVFSLSRRLNHSFRCRLSLLDVLHVTFEGD
jgi:hypothetical protein